MTLETGSRLGQYEILSPLTLAGIGEVYRAGDHENRCEVAIRVLRIDVTTDPTLMDRVVSDVLAADVLSHPNILKIYNVGTASNVLYVVSEPFEGDMLRTVLNYSKVPVRTAIGYAMQLASALVAAHRKGIVHGDVRSENILLTPTRAIVLGFGLTAATRGDSSSDVFGFAAMCRELLTRWRPHDVEPGRRRRLGWVAGLGLLALVAGIWLPVTRYLERVRESAQPTRVAAVESTTAATASSGATVVPFTDPPTEAVVPPVEAEVEGDSLESIIVSDEVPVTVAEAEVDVVVEVETGIAAAAEAETEADADAEAGAGADTALLEDASNEERAVSLDEEAGRGDVSAVTGNGGLPSAIADATVIEPSLPEPPTVDARDGRDARSLIAEALVRAAEFDLTGASELLRVTAERGDRGAEVGLIYVRGLIDAREAFRDGGTVAALAPVHGAIESLDAIAQGRRGSAEIARLVLQGAAAAAQSERDEMRLYLETAVQMELIQNTAGLSGAPLVSAAEIAGDLWLQVDRYEDARLAYTEAATRTGSSLRILAGLGRAASRLKDVLAACASYGSLLDTWGARPGLPAELAEARTYVDEVCAVASP